MKQLIADLRAGSDLNRKEIALALTQLLSAKVDPTAKAEFLKALHEKGETAEEIAGFVEQLIDRAIEKRLRLRGRPKTRAEAKSLFDHLLRQGFAFEMVGEKVRAASQTALDDVE